MEHGPDKYPAVSYSIIINGIFLYKNYYVVFLWKRTLEKKKLTKIQNECLIFDQDGGVLKEVFSVPDDLDPFFISTEGYVLAGRYRQDEIKLHIYRLEI